jgi:hypothetical protein
MAERIFLSIAFGLMGLSLLGIGYLCWQATLILEHIAEMVARTP